MDINLIIGLITIIGSMYGMLKFMLKDTHKQVEILEKEHREFREEMRIVNKKFDAMHNRLDGLYQVILDRTYGKNIPERLK